ncbi:MAG TPA: DUF692 domain-containing protein [Myxococcota bacterium]|nr:DUF692 domain-containing protein [Myxococcota bacterium]
MASRARPASESLPARCGLALRPAHFAELEAGAAGLPFLEVMAENHVQPGDPARGLLESLRARLPLTLHSVGMSLGGTDPLDLAHLARLRALADRLEPALVSDHLSWSSVGGRQLHDLLPLPYLEEAVSHVAERVSRAQDALGRRIALENVSGYARFAESELCEWEFLAAVAERADCWILFDVNNAWVSGANLGFAPETYVDSLPAERVVQLHVAGHESSGGALVDTHGAAVADPVWALFERTISRLGPRPTVLERDQNIPPLGSLLDEARKADARLARVVTRAG